MWPYCYAQILNDIVSGVNKKIVRKEIVTITKTEEISPVDGKNADTKVSNVMLAAGIWKLIKTFVFS